MFEKDKKYDQNCHFMFNNYIFIPGMPMPED